MKPPRVRHHVHAQHFQAERFDELADRFVAPKGKRAVAVSRLPFVTSGSRWVKFADRYYYVRREGLYRFWDLGRLQYDAGDGLPRFLDATRRYESMIVFRKDVRALLGANAQLTFHGNRHQTLPFDEQVRQMRRGALSLTCGPTSDFTVKLLETVGVRARKVALIRVRGPLDAFSDGHILIEVYWPARKQWVLAEMSAHFLFKQGDRYLCAGDVMEINRRGDAFDVEPFTPPGVGRVDMTDAILGEFPEGALSEAGFHDLEQIKRHMRDFYVMPGIPQDGTCWYTTDNAAWRRRVEAYQPYNRVIERDAWWRLLYGFSAPPLPQGRS